MTNISPIDGENFGNSHVLRKIMRFDMLNSLCSFDIKQRCDWTVNIWAENSEILAHELQHDVLSTI